MVLWPPNSPRTDTLFPYTTSFHSAGVTASLDYRQSEWLLTQAEKQLASLKLGKAQADNFLATLTGGPVAGPLPAPLPLVAQAQSPTLTVGLPSDQIRRAHA